MYLTTSQRARLASLLESLVNKENGDPETLAEEQRRTAGFGINFDIHSQENSDIQILLANGFISHPHYMNPQNVYSAAGIFAYTITEDGRDFLREYKEVPTPSQAVQSQTTSENGRPKVFIIHGTDPNGYLPQVENVCRDAGLDPIRMMNEPNRGMTLPEKLTETMGNSDYYVAVLTADEPSPNPNEGPRARQNAIGETMTVATSNRNRLTILREDAVDIPSNLQGIGYIDLQGQWGVKLMKEFKAANLI